MNHLIYFLQYLNVAANFLSQQLKIKPWVGVFGSVTYPFFIFFLVLSEHLHLDTTLWNPLCKIPIFLFHTAMITAMGVSDHDLEYRT